MIFPNNIAEMFSLLEKESVNGYVVGGAVRDIVMGKEPTDFDMAAECLPEDLLRIFAECRCFDHSIRFGTLNVVTDDGIVEITCCRRETGYTDLRRPDSVEFCKDIKKDLCRRDFTVNAMAMDSQGNIIDIFDGMGGV